jgi:hypothetical protein
MKKKVDKSLVTVYYRLVKTSPLMASVVVTKTLKDPSQTLAQAEMEFRDKDRGSIRIIASDFHRPEHDEQPPEEPKKGDVDEETPQSPSDGNTEE